MLTRKQKEAQIEEGRRLVKENQTLVFLDFTGADAETSKQLRRLVRAEGGAMKVIKKRLLRVLMQEMGLGFDPEQFTSQLATIFVPKAMPEIAGPLYKFVKNATAAAKAGMKLVGGFDIAAKNFIDAEMVQKIGELPPREVLLGQVVGTLAGPIRSLLYVLSEKSKQAASV